MTQEDINYFQRFGFIHYKGLLSPEEMATISDAFDEGMRLARKGALRRNRERKGSRLSPSSTTTQKCFTPC